jgi:hypothetical protein
MESVAKFHVCCNYVVFGLTVKKCSKLDKMKSERDRLKYMETGMNFVKLNGTRVEDLVESFG